MRQGLGGSTTPMLLEIAFDEPVDGWLAMTLSASGHDHVVVFSDIYPTLGRLCDALHDVWTGSCTKRAIFLEEPTEVEATFEATADGRCQVTLVRFPDRRRTLEPGERLAEVSGTAREIVLVFWRALRRLQSSLPPEQFTARWHEPFPEFEMTALTELVSNRQ